jgi:hypothetical protein
VVFLDEPSQPRSPLLALTQHVQYSTLQKEIYTSINMEEDKVYTNSEIEDRGAEHSDPDPIEQYFHCT